jgi:hypothetical protein
LPDHKSIYCRPGGVSEDKMALGNQEWRHGTVRQDDSDFAIAVLLQMVLYTLFAFRQFLLQTISFLRVASSFKLLHGNFLRYRMSSFARIGYFSSHTLSKL